MIVLWFQKDYDDGKEAIEDFLELINKLENFESSKDSIRIASITQLAQLKSSFFLMLYNLIESTVRLSIEEVYETVLINEISYLSLNGQLQLKWLSLNEKYLKEAKVENWQLFLAETFDQPLDCAKLFSGFSGNLDARGIKDVFKEHGIIPPEWTTERLRTIKDYRNKLAHGHISFIICGREYSIEDLKKYKEDVFKYLDMSLIQVNKFLSEKAYLLENNSMTQ